MVVASGDIMGDKNGTGDGAVTPPATTTRSKTPTWIGKVMDAKDEAMEAVRDAADGKMKFVLDRLESEYAEREKRSETLYEISQARAEDMQRSSENKDTTIKRLWIANIIQILIIAALAGVTVTGKIPGVGDIGLDAAEESSRPDKGSR